MAGADSIGESGRGSNAGRSSASSDRGRTTDAPSSKASGTPGRNAAAGQKNATSVNSVQSKLNQDRFEAATKKGAAKAQCALHAPVKSNQRARALEVTRQAPKGSVGAAIHPSLETAVSRFGELSAGRIGDFYERNRDLLNKPATDEDIADFVRRENEHFRAEGNWAARAFDMVLGEGWRENRIKENRDKQLGGQ